MSRIRVAGLTKCYRNPWTWKKIPVLEGLDFEIQRGEVFALLGLNGAGKTTTLKILAGLVRRSSGRFYWEGEEVESLSSMDVSFLPEEPYFYDHLTVLESLDLYGVLWGLSTAERRARIQELLEQMRLRKVRHQRVRTLSKGMHQRLGMAQALLRLCNLVLLDEPMSGIDPIGRRDFREIILSLKREGHSVIFSSHVLSDVEEVSDRAGILVSGRLRKIVSLEKGNVPTLEEVFLQEAGL